MLSKYGASSSPITAKAPIIKASFRNSLRFFRVFSPMYEWYTFAIFLLFLDNLIVINICIIHHYCLAVNILIVDNLTNHQYKNEGFLRFWVDFIQVLKVLYRFYKGVLVLSVAKKINSCITFMKFSYF